LGSCLGAQLRLAGARIQSEQIRFAFCLRREIVITGLDPVIHLLRNSFLRRWMDARIKSGHDGCILSRNRHCEERSDEAIHLAAKKEWIASSLRSSQ